MNSRAFGTQVGTGAIIAINCGFTPDRVRVVNITSTTIEEVEWFKGMADDSAIKTVTGTVARTKITSNGITPKGKGASDTYRGFAIGADTDVNVAAETICWVAERMAGPTDVAP